MIINCSSCSFIGDTEGGGRIVTEQLSTPLLSLQPYSNYSVFVSAATRVGEGVKSKPVVCSTKEDGNYNKISHHPSIFV